jgi:hypothetical protein
MRTLFAAPLVLVLVACSRGKTEPPQASTPLAPPDDDGGPAAVASAAGGSSLPSLDAFQGEIDLAWKENDPGAQPTPVVVLVKGSKVRFDLPEAAAKAALQMVGPKAYVVLDTPEKKLSVVSDERQQALLIDMTKADALRGLPGAAGPRRSADTPPKNAAHVTQTGKFDTVAGKKCEEWDVATDHRESTICVAEGDVSFLHVPSTGLPGERQWLVQVFDGRHLPLRLVSYRKDGVTEASRIEVTGMEKKELSPGAFEYPASYRVMDMARMFQGLMGMASAMPAFATPPAPKPQ